MQKILAIALLTTFAVLMTACNAPSQKEKEVNSMLNQGKYIPDIGTFMQVGSNSPAGYSWDGKQLFFRSSSSGSSQIYRLTADGWPYQLTTFEGGIDFFQLSHNSFMGMVGASTGGSEQSQLDLMNTKTGRVMTLKNGKDIK